MHLEKRKGCTPINYFLLLSDTYSNEEVYKAKTTGLMSLTEVTTPPIYSHFYYQWLSYFKHLAYSRSYEKHLTYFLIESSK